MVRPLSSWLKGSINSRHTNKSSRRRLELETLEDRAVPATFRVLGVDDATGSVTSIGGGVYSAPTLRAAIDAANNETQFAGADTIVFDLPSGQSVINAASNDAEFSSIYGATAFAITSVITIQGDANEPTVTIDGQNQRRLFGITSSGNLTLVGMTLTGGKAQGGNGGNVSWGTNYGGGGGGGAGLGGAIFNNGTLQLVQSTLSGNTAQGGNGGEGGGSAGSGGSAAGGGGGGLVGDGGSPNGSNGGGAGGASGGGTGGYGIDSPGGPGGFGGGGGGGPGNGTGGAGGFGGGGGGSGGSEVVSAGGFGGGHGGQSGPNAYPPGAGGGGAGMGGAIFNNGGTVLITASTIDGNSALGGAPGYIFGSPPAEPGRGLGGGIFNNGGAVEIIDSTLANNTAKGGKGGGPIGSTPGIGQGGGAYNRNGTLQIRNSTFSLNQVLTYNGDDLDDAVVVTSNGGRQIYNLGDGSGNTAAIVLDNTILGQSDTTTQDFTATTINGGSTSTNGSGNLIRSQNGFSGGITSTADPRLGPLQNNGGPTQTMALAPGSPAVNAGVNALATESDQRGVSRAANGNVDIGAVEQRGTFWIAISGGNNQSATIHTLFATPLTVTITSSAGEPVEGAVVNFSSVDGGVVLSASTVTVDASGHATVSAQANGIVGQYAVNVSAPWLDNSVAFTLTTIPDINPPTLPAATPGQPYSLPLTAIGGTAPYTYAVTSGDLPTGLTLSPDGVLSGIPQGNGSFHLSITVTDSSGTPGPFSSTHDYSLQVWNLVVGTLVDENDGDFTPGDLSLREAIFLANDNPDASTITFAPGLATQDVGFGPGVFGLSIVGDTSLGATALLVNSPITLIGLTGDSGLTISRDNAAAAMRLFTVNAGASLTVQDVTLSNGLARGGNGNSGSGGSGGGAGLGGAVFNRGTLNLVNTTLTGNVAQGGNGGSTGGNGGAGGGLAGDGSGAAGGAPGADRINAPGGAGGKGASGGFGAGGGGGGNGGTGHTDHSILRGGDGGDGGAGGFGGGGGGGGRAGRGNPDGQGGSGGAGGFGGGAGGTGYGPNGAAGGGGAGLGGALFNDGGTLTITNSTLWGNSAVGGTSVVGIGEGSRGQGLGGAVFNRNGVLTIVSSTLTSNTAAQGGRGVYNLGDGANNTARADIANTIIGQADTAVSDFVGGTLNGGINTTSGTGNLIRTAVGFNGTIVSTADPMLAPLTDNGGPTKTHAPQAGSPVHNAGDNSRLPTGVALDQRGTGFGRVQSVIVDIGAVEMPNQPPTDLALSNALVVKRTSVGTVVGSFSTIDPDAGDIVSYSLVSGEGDADNNFFTIDASGNLKTAANFVRENPWLYSIRVRSTDVGGAFVEKTFTIAVATINAPVVAVGTGRVVRVLDATSKEEVTRLTPFPNSKGAVDVAVGDINGDSFLDIAVASGVGRAATIRVFDGLTGQFMTSPLGELPVFSTKYKGGADVDVGDVNGDGKADLIVGKRQGTPKVQIYSGADGSVLADFSAYNLPAGSLPTSGGTRLTTGDIDGDGKAEIIVGTGAGVRNQVRIFDWNNADNTVSLLKPFGSSYKGGIFVAAGDVDGDGKAEILVGKQAGTAALRLFAADGTLLAKTTAYPKPCGVRVAMSDRDGDGQVDDLLAAPGKAKNPTVLVFNTNLIALDDFLASDTTLTSGVFVDG